MQTIYALFFCAMLNGQIDSNSCSVIDSGFSSLAQCEEDRVSYIHIVTGLDPERIKGHPISWMDRRGPFQATAVCMKKSVPAWQPAQ